jgi:hypothetical protein
MAVLTKAHFLIQLERPPQQTNTAPIRPRLVAAGAAVNEAKRSEQQLRDNKPLPVQIVASCRSCNQSRTRRRLVVLARNNSVDFRSVSSATRLRDHFEPFAFCFNSLHFLRSRSVSHATLLLHDLRLHYFSARTVRTDHDQFSGLLLDHWRSTLVQSHLQLRHKSIGDQTGRVHWRYETNLYQVEHRMASSARSTTCRASGAR